MTYVKRGMHILFLSESQEKKGLTTIKLTIYVNSNICVLEKIEGTEV